MPGALRRTLATTNPIESALSVTRRVTARVTPWRDGEMRRRWCVAGLLRAEAKFRRVKGHRAMPALLKTLEAVVQGDRVEPGGPLCENAWRNHTSAPRAEAPLHKRERLRTPRRCSWLARSWAGERPRSGWPPLFEPRTKPAASAELDRTVRPVFVPANQHRRWELNDLAGRLDS
jgi:hypothetical protein